MLDGTFSKSDDLSDDAFYLVATILPGNLDAFDLISTASIKASGLPATYPLHANGDFVPRSDCHTVSGDLPLLGMQVIYSHHNGRGLGLS
jgi:hypothetical protein